MQSRVPDRLVFALLVALVALVLGGLVRQACADGIRSVTEEAWLRLQPQSVRMRTLPEIGEPDRLTAIDRKRLARTLVEPSTIYRSTHGVHVDNGDGTFTFTSAENWYDAVSSRWLPADRRFVSCQQRGDWDYELASSDWELQIATESVHYRQQRPNGKWLERELVDLGVAAWTKGSTEPIIVPLGLTLDSTPATVLGYYYTKPLIPGVTFSLHIKSQGSKDNIILDSIGIQKIKQLGLQQISLGNLPSGAGVRYFVVVCYRVWGLDSYHKMGKAADIPVGYLAPSYAYRNPELVNGDYRPQDDEPSVPVYYYLDDGLFYILAPWEIFTDATTVVIDPTHISGSGSNEGEHTTIRNDNTDLSDGTYQSIRFQTWGASTIWSTFKFESLGDGTFTSPITISNASITLTRYACTSAGDFALSWMGTGVTTSWESTGAASDPPDDASKALVWAAYEWDSAGGHREWPGGGLVAGELPTGVHADDGYFLTTFHNAEVVTVSGDNLSESIEATIDGTLQNGIIAYATDDPTHFEANHFAAAAYLRPQIQFDYEYPSALPGATADICFVSAVAWRHASDQGMLSVPLDASVFNQSLVVDDQMSFYVVDGTYPTGYPVAAATYSADISGASVVSFLWTYASDSEYVINVSAVSFAAPVVRHVGVLGGSGGQALAIDALNDKHDQTHEMIELVTQQIASVTDSVLPIVASVSDAVYSQVEAATSMIADVTPWLSGYYLDSLIASATQVEASVAVLNASAASGDPTAWYWVGQGYYNDTSALAASTENDYQRALPANELSHVEWRAFTAENVQANNWDSYEDRYYEIHIYPDAQADTVYVASSVRSVTPPTEKSYTAKPSGYTPLW